MVDQETLALLGLLDTQTPVVRRKPRSPWEVTQTFLRENGVAPGTAKSITPAEFYRMYVAWSIKALPDWNPMGPFMFARHIRMSGFRQRRKQEHRVNRMLLRMTREAADLCQRWSWEHPEPEGYREWYRGHFFRRKDEATSPGQADREVAGDLPPDHREGPG